MDEADLAGPASVRVAEPRASELFGARAELAERFAQSLADHGPRLGLIGPRELDRLWGRHVVNCALVSELIPQDVRVADIGSGAGLPGLVLAVRRPDVQFTLIESMARRVTWLTESVAELGLSNVEVVRARAEDLAGRVVVDIVTARAVAPLTRLLGWSWPLCREGGQILAMKGAAAEHEVEEAGPWLRRVGAATPRVIHLGPPGADWSARVVTVDKPAAMVAPGRRTRR
ncbi:MAG: 16S rRNA (guanine(527)-N(7))-methyltransferase RsmG [Austwickia sp.]|jgi:16S rRNA (guanine527-N7)-methyltransferase|nr:16S rRNA (guanine(527)-N(7))-methyltransferase RsmG [Austwickia sp.]MBK8437327.1 16S rRNA (guanine(527)-N(7))-methyltransferase RsmG [Austwickia sp.]